MGGVGKTTLAVRVHDKLLNEPTFSGHVYWVTVSQEFSIDKLQTDIAQALKLNFSCGSDEKKKAAQLFQEFKKRGRFVLILDDVWKRIDVEKIGVPFERDGCKLVVTSRSEEICLYMCCEKIIKVNTLSKQEALDLFLKTLDCGEPSLEVKEICKNMVNKCGGLPLALITLAGSMRGVNDIHEWRDASERLKESRMRQAGMEIEVFPILLYSYQRLRDTRLQHCFLYCSLYPEDFRISREELIGHFVLEELMERRLNLKAEVDQGHAILNQLVRACLLESDSYGKLKMHDLVREMAIGITKDKPRYMVKAGLHLKELPEEQKWTEDLDKVSLMCNSMEEISPGTSPKCPSLSTLILRENPLRLIADCFFTQMCGLRTLDLSETEIESLPNSISDLVKLNALVLIGCLFPVSVLSLEKLKELRYLGLSFTSIKEVPQGMESLTNLKCLSLLCDGLKMIPTGTLRRHTHLQQLEWPDHLDVPMEEVETLKQLQVLTCRLNSVHDLNRLINSRRIFKPLCFYHITVGSQVIEKETEIYFPRKLLHFGEDVLKESSLDTDENKLSQDIKDLYFSRSGLSGCLLDEFPTLSSARNLKECTIEREDKIECIMRLEEEQQSRGVPFQSLERLDLTELPNLIGLFKWEAVAAPLPHGTFSCLRWLRIRGCHKIKKVFPQSLVHNFHNLEYLDVQDCAQMEEIIEDDENEGADITLPRLKSFYLKNLPQVKSICKGKMLCDSIENITLGGIKNIKEFPLYLPLLDGQLSPPSRLALIHVIGDKEWWKSLEWPHHNAKNVLQHLVKFELDGIHMDKLLSTIRDLEGNIQTLTRKIELLKSRAADVHVELQNAAHLSGKKGKREVEDWLINVGRCIREFESLEQEVQSNRFYLAYSQQKLAEGVERMIKEVVELVEQADFSGGLFLEDNESIGPAFLQNFNDIWASLMDDNILRIGIYGIGGVGKTTLAKRVHDKLLSEPKYSPHVCWASISQEFSIYKLQNYIALALKVGISKESDEKKRAVELFRELKNKGRFVLILDDLSKQIDTENIGIPLGMDGCKLIITSRSLEVCQQMGCQKIIKVNTLTEKEAWELFSNKLDSVEFLPEAEDICKKMAKRCSGLPLALATLAGSTKGVTGIHEWRDVSKELNKSCMGQANMGNGVMSILLYSFNCLKDPKLKSCFLYCSLYPEDYDIPRDELIANFISEELIDRRLSRRSAFDQGHAILNELEKACLVEIQTEREIVKMHDLIREMAITITEHNPRYMVKAGLELTEIPKVQNWTEDLDKVSLMDNNIDGISPGTSPKCPRLSSLILSKNPLKFIPECFFEQMCGLCVLNLSETSIEQLPNSISDLEKLKALLLGECSNLVYVPPLEKLRELRQLDLTGTSIEEVPQGMESLTNLELLYMDCCNLNDMPAGILNRLLNLQELTLPCHVVPPTDVERLKQLELFDGRLNSASDLNRLIKSQQSEWRLNSYHIIINEPGEVFGYDEYYPPCKVIHFGEDSLIVSSFGVDENLLPQDIEELLFEGSGLSCCLLDYFPMLYNTKDLKKCDIAVEDNIECIMRLSFAGEEEQYRGVPFQSLEDLFLNGLPNFMGLLKWEGGAEVASIPPGTFSQLKMLCIYDCRKIKKLLQWSLVQNLHNLQKLDVSNCDEMVEIIGDDDRYGRDPTVNSSANITLPKLKDLSLHKLSKLKSICKGTMNCDSIESISIHKCTELKKVPLHLQILLDGQPSAPPFLKDIKIGREEKEWWESLEWNHPNVCDVLLPFLREYW
ncbi:probable disease resistance At5g63020 [Olea europaea subsp. europaea]|uniref:Probable disease resistance At5g63020 n=1 Tax=Olea europaea subsp. europaea TaxID=158383 RepID=A0A8S0V3Y8_OLEEU|nr:probable disease resistance At5g63020 [Olea europaea subsp. europaea]